MIKRVLVIALLAPMLGLMKPSPAAAHVDFSFAIGVPFFGAVIGTPAPFYGPPVYPAPVYAPPIYVAPPVYAPPIYSAPYYAPAPFYGPRYYGPRAVVVRGYRGYPARAYYPRGGAYHFRRY